MLIRSWLRLSDKYVHNVSRVKSRSSGSSSDVFHILFDTRSVFVDRFFFFFFFQVKVLNYSPSLRMYIRNTGTISSNIDIGNFLLSIKEIFVGETKEIVSLRIEIIASRSLNKKLLLGEGRCGGGLILPPPVTPTPATSSSMNVSRVTNAATSALLPRWRRP